MRVKNFEPGNRGGVVAHILVIEDEPNLRLLLNRLFVSAGYLVTGTATGSDGLQAALAGQYDLVVLDLMLPDVNGEEILRVLMAAQPELRVLVLSSVTEIGRRVSVLDGGAADFVAKPFTNSELLARVRARLRDQPGTVRAPSRYLGGPGMQLDPHRRELVMGGRRIALSPREFVLLSHLVQRKGEVCSREELLSDVWGIGFDPGTNVVDVCVRRLRSKLRADSIETVRNVGYRFIAS
jgi:DNA-binding response OmpR family regulator